MSHKLPTYLAIVLVTLAAHATGRGDEHAARGPYFVAPGWQRGGEGLQLGLIPGVMRPSREVTMSSPTEGMLMTLHAREGRRVAEGELLATIDNRVIRAAVDVAQVAAERTADLQHAREELKLAENLLQRLLTLRSANGGSDFELLEARTRLEQARAAEAAEQERLRQAKSQLELEKARLESHNIRAPFDGQVVRIHAYPGKTLTRDDDLLTIVRLEELEAELHVPIQLFNQLEVGRSYRLMAGPPVDRRIDAELTFVAPSVDSATRTFRCVFTLENSEAELPAGFSVRLDPREFPPASPATPVSVTEAR